MSDCPIFSIVCQGHMPRKRFHCFSSLQEKQGRQAHAYLQIDEPESRVWTVTWDCLSSTGDSPGQHQCSWCSPRAQHCPDGIGKKQMH